MVIRGKPGKIIAVDWAVSTPEIMDGPTEELIPTYVIIAPFTYGQFSYAEAFLDMNRLSWHMALLQALECYGEVSEALVSQGVMESIS